MTPEPTTIRWGVTGCGWVARDYVVPAILAAQGARLVALHDVDPQALERVRAPRAQRTTDFEALCAMELDAVYVATPNHLHAQQAQALARAGLHVYCEKPMARDLEQARAMVRACQQAGVQYATAFDQRFHAAHRRARRMIEAGALGTITKIRLHYACWTDPQWRPPGPWSHDNWRADPERAGGGAMMDLAPHGLDLSQMLLGEPLEQLCCLMQRQVHDYPVDDGATIIARSANGTLVTLDLAYNCPETYPRRRLEIIGTRGRIETLNTLGQVPGGQMWFQDAQRDDPERVDFDAEDRCPFEVGVEAFSRALLQGRPFAYPPESDLHTMELLMQAQRQGLSTL